MSHRDNVNGFFDKTYKNLFWFACSPYTGWKTYEINPSESRREHLEEGQKNCDDEPNDSIVDLLEDGPKVLVDSFIKIVLSPVLFPATIVTATIALLAAVLSSIAHLVSYGIASGLDYCADNSDETTMQPQ